MITLKLLNISYLNKSSYGILVNNNVVLKESLESTLNITLPDTLEELISEKESIASLKSLMSDVSKSTSLDNVPLSQCKLLAPLLNPPKILCLGLNYVDHAAEQGKAPPEEPTLFMKPRTTIVGPYDDVVKLDWVTQLDYECELAVVIGQGGKNISMDDAFNHVFGYMVFNDVSARDIQFKDRQWTRGKSFDTFAPMGPWITTSDEIDDPHSLKMVTTVNGEVRQNSTTEQMFLKIPQIIHKISKVMTLEPGDVIPTGTPAGVALYLKPSPKFLEKDDVVKLSIDGLGSLENKIISDS